VATLSHAEKLEKKEMYELWKVCVDGWRREVQAKSKKEGSRLPSLEQMTLLSKK
jgi:hypothetical protein